MPKYFKMKRSCKDDSVLCCGVGGVDYFCGKLFL